MIATLHAQVSDALGVTLDQVMLPASTWNAFLPTSALLSAQVPLPNTVDKIVYSPLIGNLSAPGSVFQAGAF